MRFLSKPTAKPMARPTHRYELTEAADGDLLAIARYTIKKWGVPQARRYESALHRCFGEIGEGKIRSRVFLKKRAELLFTHCEHHYIFYVMRENSVPLIIAVLHENMNLITRVKNRLRA